MTTLKSEQIYAALATALGGVSRNQPLIDFDGTFTTLHDGDVELVEEFFNPHIREFTGRPALLIAVSGEGALDAALAGLIEASATTLAGITDQLGGLVTDIRPQPPQFAPKELFGALNMKGAEIIIEIDYYTDSSLG